MQATVITTGNNVDYYSFDADKSGTVLEEGTILSDPTISNFTYVATPTTLAITFAPGTIPGEATDVQNYTILSLANNFLDIKSDVTNSATGVRNVFEIFFKK